MSFTLRVDGKVVHQEESQVTGVHLMSARGEVAAMGISTEGVVDIVLDKVAPGSPPRLDQIEQAQFQALRDRAEEGVVVGHPRPDAQVPIEGQLTSQGIHDETLRPGGVNQEEVQASMIVHPTRDLFDGLQPNDTATRTARIESFGTHGDVKRAIDDNPPGSGGQESEGSVVPSDAGTGAESSPSSTGDSTSDSTGVPPAPVEGSGEGSPEPLVGAGLNLGGQPGAPGDIAGTGSAPPNRPNQ